MNVQIVSAREFWNLLLDKRAFRLSWLSAGLGSQIFVTLEAPEDKPGFMDEQYYRAKYAVAKLLGRRP